MNLSNLTIAPHKKITSNQVSKSFSNEGLNIQKELAEQNFNITDKNGNIEKAHIKQHQRKTKSGKLINVKEHEDKRKSRIEEQKIENHINHHNKMTDKHDSKRQFYVDKEWGAQDNKKEKLFGRIANLHDDIGSLHYDVSIIYDEHGLSSGDSLSSKKKNTINKIKSKINVKLSKLKELKSQLKQETKKKLVSFPVYCRQLLSYSITIRKSQSLIMSE